MPFPVTKEVLERGQERYNIYLRALPLRVGDGNGFVPSRGFSRKPPSFHIVRLQKAPLGYFFDIITEGFGIMPDYASQIPPQDRWNIVAYVRALQLSQNATMADMPPDNIPSDAAEVPRARIGRELARGVPEVEIEDEGGSEMSAAPVKQLDLTPPPVVNTIAQRSLIVGVVFGIVAVIASRSDPTSLSRLPLGFMYWLGVALGSMAIHHDPSLDRRRMGRRHSPHSRRGHAHPAIARGIIHSDHHRHASLYIWARPLDQIADKHIREHLEDITKTYLTSNGFWIRAMFYFAIWNLFRSCSRSGQKKATGPALPTIPSASKPSPAPASSSTGSRFLSPRSTGSCRSIPAGFPPSSAWSF